MPGRSNSGGRSSSSSRTSSYKVPAKAPAKAPVHVHEVNTSMGIMEGVKWGIGTSIGHSIAGYFGFGGNGGATQTHHVEKPKDTFEQCIETNATMDKRLDYCTYYSKCMSDYTDNKNLCRERALEHMNGLI